MVVGNDVALRVHQEAGAERLGGLAGCVPVWTSASALTLLAEVAAESLVLAGPLREWRAGRLRLHALRARDGHDRRAHAADQVCKAWQRRDGRRCNRGCGTLCRGGRKARAEAAKDEEIVEWLTKDGKLVKRPVVVAGVRVLVGFDEKAYAEAFG